MRAESAVMARFCVMARFPGTGSPCTPAVGKEVSQ
jgi:hypothetical protein